MATARNILIFIFILQVCFVSNVTAKPAVTSTIKASNLIGFAHYPARLKHLVRKSLALTTMNLTYKFGSNHPKNGGMDCSGTIQYLLKSVNLRKLPRQADGFLHWSQRHKTFVPVSAYSLSSAQFNKLKPGDLLFWKGTYNTKRDASHVMLYLGVDKTTGRPVMFGATDGRRHNDKRIRGVSVFDFKLPKKGKRAKFIGYGAIPGFNKKH